MSMMCDTSECSCENSGGYSSEHSASIEEGTSFLPQTSLSAKCWSYRYAGMLSLLTDIYNSFYSTRPEVVNYRNTGGKWPGFRRGNHFAVRWTGRLRIFKSGRYHFQLISDDGSKLWIEIVQANWEENCASKWGSKVCKQIGKQSVEANCGSELSQTVVVILINSPLN